MAEATQSIGKVVQVIGPVLDVQFAPDNLPELYNAVELEWTGDEGEAHRLVPVATDRRDLDQYLKYQFLLSYLQRR